MDEALSNYYSLLPTFRTIYGTKWPRVCKAATQMVGALSDEVDFSNPEPLWNAVQLAAQMVTMEDVAKM